MQPDKVTKTDNFARSLSAAQSFWPGQIGPARQERLKELVNFHALSVAAGDLLLIDGTWYVSHSGLLRIARRNRCSGIQTEIVSEFCDPAQGRWVIKATVYKTSRSKGFVGYGDADPSNVSTMVRGAEMRVAETRAVNRALRKAYGIGLCSVDEIGSNPEPPFRGPVALHSPKKGSNGGGDDDGNGQPRLRDRLCLLIRQHKLDPIQIKRYAADFCQVGSLREATREQIEQFLRHLTELAVQDREKLAQHLQAYADNPAKSPEAA
jgi:hypothetical protein